MEGSVQGLYTSVLLLLASTITYADRGRMYMVNSPGSISMPINDETVLTCEMNINPDKFQWRYYPLGAREASNPKAQINLAKNLVIDIPTHKEDKKRSTLSIKSFNESVAGDYQCLAHYGASVVASIPDRITITTLQNFPPQSTHNIRVTVGNTVLWRCEPPVSNPPAYIDYSKNGQYYEINSMLPPTDSLILVNVSYSDTGMYRCKASNSILQDHRDSNFYLHLNVVDSAPEMPPKFILPPKLNYTVKKGDSIFMECSAIGNPVPVVTWYKIGGQLIINRTEFVSGGLRISNVESGDDGIYVCSFSNSLGKNEHRITLIYNEAPIITHGPKSTNLKEGVNLDLSCTVTGTPEPTISWFLNGKSVLTDNQIEAVGNRIYFTPLEKRHAGVLQCFASNVVGTNYSSADLNVTPTEIYDNVTMPPPGSKKRKHKSKRPKHKGTPEMVPPLKPTVSRVNDESVVVRWSVPPNNGLPIQFFKVQYRELGSTNQEEDYQRSSQKAKWKTINHDIPPNVMSYEVNNLKAEHQYKFRIAAVYSNNDNKLSPKSDKFTLTRGDFFIRNPLPIPKLSHTEAVNATSIRVYWDYTPSNMSIDGFFINYISASSAGDYTKISVDGEYTNQYVITHLQPDTVYDIKMQSFTTKSASEFTPILKQKTLRLPTEPPVTTSMKPDSEKASEIPQKYIFIGVGAAVVALLLTVIVSFFICKKWKQKKNLGNSRGDHNDKPAVEEVNHHIQADGNNYVTTPKSMSRANGCALPPNRITITANPLADADNKNSNMIEMSCLSSQNNNCSITQPSASTEESHDGNIQRNKGKHKNKEKSKRNKNLDPSAPGENYV